MSSKATLKEIYTYCRHNNYLTINFRYNLVKACWADEPNVRPSFKYLTSEFEKLLGNNAKYIGMQTNAFSNPNYSLEDAETIEVASTEAEAIARQTLKLNQEELESLDHLWRPPKLSYDTQDCCNSRETTTFSSNFQAPPGYDMPRPLLETYSNSHEKRLRYENDLKFPRNIRKSSIAETTTHHTMPTYSVPVKRGRSYMDMTNKTLLSDNLDNDDFEKHISKTISFRFSSLLNLTEQDDSVA